MIVCSSTVQYLPRFPGIESIVTFTWKITIDVSFSTSSLELTVSLFD